MGSTNAKVWLARSQFVNKAGIARGRASIGTCALGFALKSKICALRKKQVRQLIILNLRYLERSMHNIKHKVDVIMFQVSKLKKVEN
jgi:hypothetical protein